MDDLEQLELLSLVSKVSSEIGNYMGVSDKTIAEFVIAEHSKATDLADFRSKLEEFDFAVSRESSSGLPLTEIYEDLDDDGNVVSSRLEQCELSPTQLLDSLQKAGLSDQDLSEPPEGKPLKPAITNVSPPLTPAPSSACGWKRTKPAEDGQVSSGDSADDNRPSRPPIRKKSVSFTVDTKPANEVARPESEDGRKSVSFAEKVAVAPAAPPPDSRSVSFSARVEDCIVVRPGGGEALTGGWQDLVVIE